MGPAHKRQKPARDGSQTRKTSPCQTTAFPPRRRATGRAGSGPTAASPAAPARSQPCPGHTGPPGRIHPHHPREAGPSTQLGHEAASAPRRVSLITQQKPALFRRALEQPQTSSPPTPRSWGSRAPCPRVPQGWCPGTGSRGDKRDPLEPSLQPGASLPHRGCCQLPNHQGLLSLEEISAWRGNNNKKMTTPPPPKKKKQRRKRNHSHILP